jgi:hypothetical protein
MIKDFCESRKVTKKPFSIVTEALEDFIEHHQAQFTPEEGFEFKIGMTEEKARIYLCLNDEEKHRYITKSRSIS